MVKDFETARQKIIESGEYINLEILIAPGFHPEIHCDLHNITSKEVSFLFLALNDIKNELKNEFHDAYTMSKFIKHEKFITKKENPNA